MFTFAKRVLLFLATNMAVMLLLGIIMAVVTYYFPGLSTASGGMYYLLIYAAVLGFGGALISLAISRWSAKRGYSIVLVNDENIHTMPAKLQLVHSTVARIAMSEGIDMPEVGYYESAEPNAFATWPTKNSALVAVSTGLINTMENGEIEWVVGHEMAHILNGDMVTLTLVQGVMNTFVVFLSSIVSRIIAGYLSRDGDGGAIWWLAYNMVYIATQMVFGFFASLVVNAFSRAREYRADEGGAKYTSKAKMISGLKKLQSMSQLIEKPTDTALAAMQISSAEGNEIFSTHPHIAKRIAALEANYMLP